MKTSRTQILIATALVGALTALTGTASAQSTRWDELSKLPFKESYPTPEASARLYDDLQFQRAVQVYLWALPAMSMVAMRDGQAARPLAAATTSSRSGKTAPTPKPSSPPPIRT